MASFQGSLALDSYSDHSRSHPLVISRVGHHVLAPPEPVSTLLSLALSLALCAGRLTTGDQISELVGLELITSANAEQMTSPWGGRPPWEVTLGCLRPLTKGHCSSQDGLLCTSVTCWVPGSTPFFPHWPWSW